MPRSVLEIDVDDSRFKDFLALYKGYHEQLSEASKLWGDASEAAAGTETATGSMSETIAATAASTALIVEALERAEPAARAADDKMKSMGAHAKAIEASIVSATRNLAKWATLSLGAGLLGVGGSLWGLDHLASSVSAQRRTAQGLGISSGELAAFNVNFGQRLGLGTDFISRVQDVATDMNSQPALLQLGIPWSEIQSGDHAQLTADVIRRAHQLWQRFGPSQRNQQTMDAMGLGKVMDFSTWQRIGAQSDKDIEDWTKQYVADSPTMGASDPVQRAYQEFATQLDRAGERIRAVFFTGLEPLIPGLETLSKDVEQAVAAFMHSKKLEGWINELGKGILWLGNYLGSDRFQSDLERAETGLESFMTAVESAAAAIGAWFPSAHADGTADDSGGTLPGMGPLPGFPGVPGLPGLPGLPGPGGLPAETPAQRIEREEHAPGMPGWGFTPGRGFHFTPLTPPATRGNAADPSLPRIDENQSLFERLMNPGAGLDFSGIERADQLPAGLLRAIGMRESGLHAAPKDSVVDGVHYQGMFQLGPAMQYDYGVKNPYDPNQEANAAGMAMRDYLAKYHGDITKALAAYNWKPKELDRDIAEHGDAWQDFAPKETQAYIAEVLKEIHRQAQPAADSGSGGPPSKTALPASAPAAAPRVDLRVSVTNQTGANVAILQNAVRQ